MAGGLYGYPVFGGLLINECFTLAETKLNSKGTLEKTNCLKSHKQNYKNNYDLYIPHIVTL